MCLRTGTGRRRRWWGLTASGIACGAHRVDGGERTADLLVERRRVHHAGSTVVPRMPCDAAGRASCPLTAGVRHRTAQTPPQSSRQRRAAWRSGAGWTGRQPTRASPAVPSRPATPPAPRSRRVRLRHEGKRLRHAEPGQQRRQLGRAFVDRDCGTPIDLDALAAAFVARRNVAPRARREVAHHTMPVEHRRTRRRSHGQEGGAALRHVRRHRSGSGPDPRRVLPSSPNRCAHARRCTRRGRSHRACSA